MNLKIAKETKHNRCFRFHKNGDTAVGAFIFQKCCTTFLNLAKHREGKHIHVPRHVCIKLFLNWTFHSFHLCSLRFPKSYCHSSSIVPFHHNHLVTDVILGFGGYADVLLLQITFDVQWDSRDEPPSKHEHQEKSQILVQDAWSGALRS